MTTIGLTGFRVRPRPMRHQGIALGLLLGLWFAPTSPQAQPQPPGAGPHKTAVVHAASIAGPSTRATPECPPDGNVNQDGDITPADALLALRHFLGSAEPPLVPCQQERADVTQDSRITPADALCIFQRSLELPSCLGTQSRAARLEAVAGDGTGSIVDTQQRLIIRVTDTAGGPVAGITVRFRITEPTAGTRNLSASEVVTGSDGQAETVLTVDQKAGPNRVEASVDGLASVTFTVTGCFDRNSARLIRVEGNSQSGRPGDELPEPLVSRLEDQFGNPGPGETLAITPGESAEVTVLTQGGAKCPTAAAALTQPRGLVVLAAQAGEGVTAVTDAQGEVRFRLQIRADASDEDFRVQVSAPELPQVEPVQFLVIVGSIDTPDIPLALGVSGNVVYVVDRFSGLPVFDVSDPLQPVQLHNPPLDLEGTELRLALDGNRAYVATVFPARLYILDTSNPQAANFPADTNGDRMPDVVLGKVDLPDAVQNHEITGVAVQGGLAYVVTHRRTSAEGEGTLQVLDISVPASPQVVGSLMLSASRPQAIAVAGEAAYVPAGGGGLLTIDIHDRAQPALVRTIRDTENIGFSSGIVLRSGFAYVVESRCDGSCNSISATALEYRFTVFDLSIPTNPQRRGEEPVRGTGPLAIDGRFAYLGQFANGLLVMDINDPADPKPVGTVGTPSVVLNVAAAGGFIYVTDQIFGLQVIPGAPPDAPDTDGDGIIDRFDAFPRDPKEVQDTDRDGIGDNADPDDDNDGFPDLEEQGDPFADPKNPQIFPPGRPPAEATSIVVDAASSTPPRERNGSVDAPYRSVTEAIRALHKHRGLPVQTVVVQPGIYSPLTTQELFPIDLTGLSGVTLRSTAPDDSLVVEFTVLDAGFAGDILLIRGNAQMTVEGLTLVHGGHGILANAVTGVTIRRNVIAANIFDGIALGINANAGNTITENGIHSNGQNGVSLFEQSQATLTGNAIGTARGNGGTGIFVSASSTAQITANELTNNAAGIGIDFTSDATIANNTVMHNEQMGILIQQGSRATVTSNTLSQNGGVTLFFIPPDLAAATDFTVLGVGIAVNNQSTAEITGNTIDANLAGGIVIERNSTATITGNTVRNNGLEITPNGFGMVFFENADAEIGGGEISQNGGHGIFVSRGSRADIGPRGNFVTVSDNLGAGIAVNLDGSVARIGSAQDDVICVLVSPSFPFPCLQVAFVHVFRNGGGDFVPPLPGGPYVPIP